jgi:putative ABC transport system permease protein
MKADKLRLFLILLSITLSTGLFISTIGLGSNLEQVYRNQRKNFIGNSDLIVVLAEEKTNSLEISDFEPFAQDIDVMAKTEYAVVQYEGPDLEADEPEAIRTYNGIVRSFDLNKAFELESIVMNHEYNEETFIEGFTKDKIIIPQTAADKSGYNLGDIMTLYVQGEAKVFEIYGIAKNVGVFIGAETEYVGIVPEEGLEQLRTTTLKDSMILIKTNINPQRVKDKILSERQDVHVYYMTDPAYFESQVSEITDIIFLAMILVLIMSGFIIYTTVTVITVERLKVTAILRSIGATRRIANLVLLAETLMYGLVGSILGSGLGLLLLRLMADFFSYNPQLKQSIPFELTYSVEQVFFGMLVGMLLSVLSGLIPIIRSNRFDIKKVMRGDMEQEKKNTHVVRWVGVVLIILCAFSPVIFHLEGSLMLSAIVTLGSLVGFVICTPLIVANFIKYLEKLTKSSNSVTWLYALKNIKTSQKLVNNIILLVIALTVIISINTITRSTIDGMLDMYAHHDYQLKGYLHEKTEDNMEKLRGIEGVEEVMPYYVNRVYEVEGSEGSFNIYYSDVEKMIEYHQMTVTSDVDYIKALKEGTGIILNKNVLKLYQLKIGDSITFVEGNQGATYNIVGSVNNFFSSGQSGFMYPPVPYAEYIHSSSLNIRSNLEGAVIRSRIDKVFDGACHFQTIEDMQEEEKSYNYQVFAMIEWLSYLTLIIGSVGMFNNLVTTMKSREKQMAIFRSVGMSRRQLRKIVVAEGIICALLSGLIAIGCSGLMLHLVTYLVTSMQLILTIYWYPLFMLWVIGLGVAISVLATLVANRQNNHRHYLELIQYE